MSRPCWFGACSVVLISEFAFVISIRRPAANLKHFNQNQSRDEATDVRGISDAAERAGGNLDPADLPKYRRTPGVVVE